MEGLTSKDKILLDKVNLSINKNIANEKYTVEQLAKEVCLSRSMLHRKLIKTLGKSANDLIMEARLDYAKELLLENSKTVSEIAYEVGFKTPSYFNKVFKDRFNISPGAFQNNKDQAKVKSNKLPFFRIEFNNKLILKVLLLLFVLAVFSGVGYVIINKTRICCKGQSIAILPFDNLSSDVENQFLADGIIEDLLSRLSKVEGLKVISSTSSSRFRNRKNKTIKEISKQLYVRYILEGSIQRISEKVSLNVQLIDARKDKHIWSKLYDKEMDEMFEIQSELSREISKELCFVLTDKEKKQLSINQTLNSEALKNKQIGCFYLDKRTEEGLRKSVPYFKKAIKIDSTYALAYAELADAYFLMAWYNVVDRKVGMDSARYWANKALGIDRDLAEAHNILAYVLWENRSDVGDVEKEFKKAIKLNPNYSLAHQYYAEFLATYGRRKEARMHIKKAIELNPLSFIHHFVSSRLYLLDKDYKNALSEISFVKEINEHHEWCYRHKFYIYVSMGDEQYALESFKELGVFTGCWTAREADAAFRNGGIKGLLQFGLQFQTTQLNKLEFYLMSDQLTMAVKQMDEMIRDGVFHPYITIDVAFEKLNSHPRYIEILDSIGIKPN